MTFGRLAALGLALLLGGCGAIGPGRDVAIVWTALRQADAKALLVEAGAKIKAEEQTKDHGWLITAEVPDGLPVTWEGMQCKGDGPERACTEHQIDIPLQTASPAAAQAIAAGRDVLYPADAAVENEYRVWRMDFTYGGVTRAHLKATLLTMIDMGWAAAKDVEARGK